MVSKATSHGRPSAGSSAPRRAASSQTGVAAVVRHITQYRVFIGSPGGLETERKRFQGALDKVSRTHGAHHGIHFHPVGWEDTLNGAGRPQTIINAEIEDCDYAVFVLHDRWGTAPGRGFTSGTEEEFRLTERLYKANKIRQIALFFKQVDPRQARDPGGQLKQVLAFRQRIVNGRQYLFKSYDTVDEFGDVLKAMEQMEKTDLIFPINQYKYFGALAIISEAYGDLLNAKRMARDALEAQQKDGPFSRHKDAGIVRNIEASIHKRLWRLAA